MLGKIEGRKRVDDRGWDGWTASLTQWRWVWASSGSWWWTGKPGMLQSMGSHSKTRLSKWTELNMNYHRKKSHDQPRQHIKKQRHYFPNKGPYSQSYGFSSSHVWMWELDHKQIEHQRIDAFKVWCWRRLLRVPWTAKRSNQSILKEINPTYSFIGRTDAEAPILQPPDANSQLIRLRTGWEAGERK